MPPSFSSLSSEILFIKLIQPLVFLELTLSVLDLRSAYFGVFSYNNWKQRQKVLFCGAVYKYHNCTYGKTPWNTSFAFNEYTAFVAFLSWQQNSVLVFVVILVTKGIPYLLSWADGTPVSQKILSSQSSDKDLLFPFYLSSSSHV